MLKEMILRKCVLLCKDIGFFFTKHFDLRIKHLENVF